VADSLIINDTIELLGGGVASVHPMCPGAVFRLGTGFDFSAPQPRVDFLISQILDGELPVGDATSNRTPTLPIRIFAPDRFTLAGAKELVMRTVNAPSWTLKWRRDDYGSGRDSAAVITNGTFEAGVSGWTAQNGGTFTQSNTQAHSGTFSGKLTGNGSTANPQVLGGQAAVVAGQGAGITGWLFCNVAQTVTVLTEFFDAGGTHIAGADVPAAFAVPAGGWSQFTAGAIAPAGAAFAAMVIQMTGTPPGTTTLFIDDLTLMKAADFTELLALPMVMDCYRANPAVPVYSLIKDHNRQADLTVSFAAAPFGRSDLPVTIPVASPLPGFTPPPPSVVLSTFASVNPAVNPNFVASTRSVLDGTSARWIPGNAPLNSATGAGSQPGAVYAETGIGPFDLTGLAAFGVWVGLGTDYWATWHKGPVHLRYTLTDNAGHTLKFGITKVLSAGNSPGSPVWRQVTAPIPLGNPVFNYAAVTGYSVTVSNRGFNTLRYTQLYLNHAAADPGSVVNQLPAVRGAMYSARGVIGTARSPGTFILSQTAGTGTPVTVTLPGPGGTVQEWPVPLGVSSVQLAMIAPGGTGGKAKAANTKTAGAGGGESANQTLTVTPLAKCTYNLGLTGFAANGGMNPFFTTDLGVTVSANRGGSVTDNSATPGVAGSGSAATTHFNGGAGAAPGTNAGGGGSSAGPAVIGNNAAGQTGGAAPTGGGKGANGANAGGNSGKNGSYPGGGGSGATTGSIAPGVGEPGGLGGGGRIQLTYTPTVNTFSAFLLHLPGAQAPDNLVPYIALDPTDTPNGTVEYPAVSAVPGQNADFNGTYTLMACATSFNSSATPRDVTVTINQYEYPGGPVYSVSAKRNQFTPANDVAGATYTGVSGLNGVVLIGEVTLPIKALPDENTTAYYTATITDSNTSDTWQDLIFIDNEGSTVFCNVPVAGAYGTYWVMEAEPWQAVGGIYGSDFDLSAALSVFDWVPIISGPPPSLVPGDNSFFIWSEAGAPGLDLKHFPRFHLDRTQ
jgi:hypothetical protein